mmetsp:Transcript_29967/g.69715  ORF Transcript_29967/g.69715 Transcript_29967/m.69715 type:complete len:295 (-) Transcript_29967:241-1125(-)
MAPALAQRRPLTSKAHEQMSCQDGGQNSRLQWSRRNHHVWGRVDLNAGAASDESESDSSVVEDLCVAVAAAPAKPLVASLDEKLDGVCIHQEEEEASPSSSIPSPNSEMSAKANKALEKHRQNWRQEQLAVQEIGKDDEDTEEEEEQVSDTEDDDEDDEQGGQAGSAASKYVGLDVRSPTWSVGSELHESGTCRPCAWYWKSVGCTSGFACQFCHLCGPGVFQLKTAIRRAERVAELKAMQRKYRGGRRAKRPQTVPPGPVGGPMYGVVMGAASSATDRMPLPQVLPLPVEFLQ